MFLEDMNFVSVNEHSVLFQLQKKWILKTIL